MDWSALYPGFFPTNGDGSVQTAGTAEKASSHCPQSRVEFADIGCGYGGLLGWTFCWFFLLRYYIHVFYFINNYFCINMAGCILLYDYWRYCWQHCMLPYVILVVALPFALYGLLTGSLLVSLCNMYGIAEFNIVYLILLAALLVALLVCYIVGCTAYYCPL